MSCPMLPVPLNYKVQEGNLQRLGHGCGDVISHDRQGTSPWRCGRDRFTVTQHNMSLAHKSGTSPRDGGVIAHSIFIGSLPQPILGLPTTLQSHTQRSGRSQVFTPLPGG